MHPTYASPGGTPAIPIWFVDATSYPSVRDGLEINQRAFAEAAGFEPKPGRHLLLPGPNGLGGVLFGLDAPTMPDPFLAGRLSGLLPNGTYRFANAPRDRRLAALAFALGAYRFSRYSKPEDKAVRLEIPAGVDGADLTRIADGVTMARDLINTPANDLGPAELEETVRGLGQKHGAKVRSVVGDALLTENFPLIHAVGRAAAREPRLIDLTWGDAEAPKITLVGKGVCFDTGGLDIKPDTGMLIMKKDMGGAACVMALAHMIMDRGLKVRLRMLVPAVENSISGSAFRPLDVYRSRKGITVEIGNTDAEGRLILADALALADEEAPALVVDMATLTGAARVALGPDLPPFYTDDDAFATDLASHAAAENDPLWRMPLWRPYDSLLDSKTADINNVSPGGQGGSITAALFLRRFLEQTKTWLHLDVYAWTQTTKSGRPEGGDCQAARALYALLTAGYSG
jgi:leucyl aminopeptidase